MFVYITWFSEKYFSAEIFAYWRMVRRNFKNVCMVVFFLLNLGRRYHIKYKAQAEMLHNTEKHKNNDSRGEFQN